MLRDARLGLAQVARGEGETVEGWIAYGRALNEGLALFHPEDDKGFGLWIETSLLRQVGGVNVHDHERSAAMWAASCPDEFEAARAAGNARTVRGIHAYRRACPKPPGNATETRGIRGKSGSAAG